MIKLLKVNAQQFMSQFPQEQQEDIKRCLQDTDRSVSPAHGLWAHAGEDHGVVCFRNEQMDSSHFGEATGVLVGPGCSTEGPEQCEGRWLYDLPSQRQYAVSWCPVQELREWLQASS